MGAGICATRAGPVSEAGHAREAVGNVQEPRPLPGVTFTYHTVRAEIITKLILKRAGPVILKTFYWN